jgi:hypothetical protein
MRFAKLLLVSFGLMLLVGVRANHGSGAAGVGNPLLNGTILADGGAPLPPPSVEADGGAPLPPPSVEADGGAPLPPPTATLVEFATVA